MVLIARRRFLITLPALAATATAHANGLQKVRDLFDQVMPSPRVTGVLLDVSGSILPGELEIYRTAMLQATAAVRRGDRIVLGEISERLQPQFRLAFDLRAPDTGRSRADDAVAGAKAKEAMALFERVASREKRASRSCIMDAVAAMGDVLMAAPERTKSLLVLSDMIEDSSSVGNFDRPRLKIKDISAVVTRAKSAGLARELSGLEVRVCGAAGRDAAHYDAIRACWHAWLERACGARIVYYGRTPPAVTAG